mmetsp:Transcript_31660/g.73196  ORF Transcript_31660/g.73196 Transcript_31660/m.73196 type:complete len:421 (-) Transcript_31660:72-1334(-)
MAQSPEMQSALADFKAANVTEIRSLCGAGLSRSNAISKILERICESKDPAKVVQEADMTEAAGLAHRLGMAADDALHSLIVRREMRKIKAGGNVSDAEAVVELTRRIRVEVPTRPAPLPTATSPIASSSAAAATAAVSPPHASATGAALSPSAGTKPCVAKPHQAGPHRKRGEAGSPGGLERSSSLKRTRRSTSNGKPGAKPGKPAAAKQAAEQVQTEMDADKVRRLRASVYRWVLLLLLLLFLLLLPPPLQRLVSPLTPPRTRRARTKKLIPNQPSNQPTYLPTDPPTGEGARAAGGSADGRNQRGDAEWRPNEHSAPHAPARAAAGGGQALPISPAPRNGGGGSRERGWQRGRRDEAITGLHMTVRVGAVVAVVVVMGGGWRRARNGGTTEAHYMSRSSAPRDRKKRVGRWTRARTSD